MGAACSGTRRLRGFLSWNTGLHSHFSNKIWSLNTGEAPRSRKGREFPELPFEFAFKHHSQSRTVSPVILWAGWVGGFRCWRCTNHVNTREINESQMRCHVTHTHIFSLGVFFNQSLLYFFPLKRNVMEKIFQVKRIFIIPIWLKLADYSLSSCYLDCGNLCKRRD